MRFIELIREYAKRLKIDDTLNEDGSIDITYGGERTSWLVYKFSEILARKNSI